MRNGLISAYASTGKILTQEFTRPANTTDYADGDAISNGAVISFPNAVRSDGGFAIVKRVQVITNAASKTPKLKLRLYNAAPAAPTDNAALPFLYANVGKELGTIALPAMTTDPATGSDVSRSISAESSALPIQIASGRTLYAILEANDIFTPTSGQKFTVAITLVEE